MRPSWLAVFAGRSLCECPNHHAMEEFVNSYELVRSRIGIVGLVLIIGVLMYAFGAGGVLAHR